MNKLTTFLLVVLSSSLVSSHCPKEDFRHLGACTYRIKCYYTIENAKLDSFCEGSVNKDVVVDVTLKDAIDSFPINVIDTEFLTSITTLTILGNWPTTNLSFLEYTFRLKNLNLVNLQMKQINGSPFQYLGRLEKLDLSYNKLTDIDELFVFDNTNKISKLSLAYNAIEEIPGYVFQELISLKELDLSHNFIRDLTEEPFSNLTNLETLRLNNNLIKNLNGAINDKLVNLKHLFLSHNLINKIDEKSHDRILHLETFEISHNKIDKAQTFMLTRHWDHLNNFHYFVCRIVLSENYISVVPNATSEIILDRYKKHPIDIQTELDLSRNNITLVNYNAFRSIVNLISLDLSHNKLIDFVINNEDLAYIKYLNLSSNFISKLHFSTFSLMNNLQNLDLSNNRFDNVPDEPLSYNYNFKRINITYNDIRKVDNFRVTFNSEGGTLDLSNNGLSSFNILPGEAARLTELVLHSNNITDPSLVILNHHHNLTKLDLSENYIEELNELSLHLPVTLKYLDLSKNRIQRIGPSSFLRVPHLSTLRMNHNYLTDIEYGAFHGLTELQNLDLSFNEIHTLNSKVLLDLKFLRYLSIRNNSMNVLDCDAWLSHETELTVFLDGNNLSCDWLGTAVINYNNGYSKMRPAALLPPLGYSVEGIPCEKGALNLEIPQSQHIMTDERLLATSQKILEAVKDQTSYLKKYIWRSILIEAEKTAKEHAIEKFI